MVNYRLDDWLAHWKYGVPRENIFLGKWPKIRAIYLFLFTKISIERG